MSAGAAVLMTISNLLRRSGCAPVILAAALAGCATPSGVGPPSATRESGSAPVVKTREFAAVVVQPGETLSSLAATWLHDPSRAWEIAAYNGIDAAAPGQEVAIPLHPFRRGGLTRERYQTVPVLTYHQFAEKSKNRMTVTREAFAAQMQLLKDKGYRVISLSQLVDFLDFGGQIPEKSVVITIDDGWRTTYDIAFPILRQYGYPATLFVYTQLITGGKKTLSWDQIREMSEQGLDVQCHTITHRNLALPEDTESAAQYFTAVAREISESTRTIEQKLGKRPTIMAYPYGDTNGLAITLLKQQGYRAGLTVEREANPFFAAPFRLGRSMIYGDFDLAKFERNLRTTDHGALR